MIRKIENDEWVHREKVGKLLAQLGASPLSGRELRSSLVGHALCFLCSFSGWFLPMYFAGRLETRNVEQYDAAAGYAAELGLDHFINERAQMLRRRRAPRRARAREAGASKALSS